MSKVLLNVLCNFAMTNTMLSVTNNSARDMAKDSIA